MELMNNPFLFLKEQNEMLQSQNAVLLSKLEKIESKVNEIETSRAKFSDLLTAKETKEKLDISYPTLHKWSNKGILKKLKIGGRIFYRRKDIENALIETEAKRA